MTRNNIKLSNAYTQWNVSRRFDVFATFTFVSCHKPSVEASEKIMKAFFNKLDRLIYGQTGKHNIRLERMVFFQSGANNSNPHFHVLLKSPIDPTEFSIILNALWAGFGTKTATVEQNEMSPIISASRSAGYCDRENKDHSSLSYNPLLSYLLPDHIVATPKVDVHQRLVAKCNREFLSQSRENFPEQMERIHDRMARRDLIKTRVAKLSL